MNLKKGYIYRLNCGAVVQTEYVSGHSAKYRVLYQPPISKIAEFLAASPPPTGGESMFDIFVRLSENETWYVPLNGCFMTIPPNPHHAMSVRERIKP